MGIDYYNCTDCGRIFADCGECTSCESCEAYICGQCMNKYNVTTNMCHKPTEEEVDEGEWDQCPYCSGEAKVPKSDAEYIKQLEAFVKLTKSVLSDLDIDLPEQAPELQSALEALK